MVQLWFLVIHEKFALTWNILFVPFLKRNLTLHMLNPMNLVTETVFQGFHDRDDPGPVRAGSGCTMVLIIIFYYPHRSIMPLVSFSDQHRVFWWKWSHHQVNNNENLDCVHLLLFQFICRYWKLHQHTFQNIGNWKLKFDLSISVIATNYASRILAWRQFVFLNVRLRSYAQVWNSFAAVCECA